MWLYSTLSVSVGTAPSQRNRQLSDDNNKTVFNLQQDRKSTATTYEYTNRNIGTE